MRIAAPIGLSLGKRNQALHETASHHEIGMIPSPLVDPHGITQ
jgi:hypothetical protein